MDEGGDADGDDDKDLRYYAPTTTCEAQGRETKYAYVLRHCARSIRV
jgi:hypothetical protein